jgi:putative FmdB family regulatory protein
MPIYTYRCESCGVQFEKQQKFSDAPLLKCPECNKKTLRKVYQPVGIVFKGSGFYATDHRSPSGAPRHTTSKSEDGDSTVKSTEMDSKTSSSESKAESSKSSDD